MVDDQSELEIDSLDDVITGDGLEDGDET